MVVGFLLWLLSAFGNRLGIAGLSAGGRQAGSRWVTHTRSIIMIGQIAFCVALLLVSAIVVRSFVALQRAPNGFDSAEVPSAQVRHPIMKPGEVVKHYPTRRFARLTDEIVAGARSLPGVVSAAAAWYAPLACPSVRQSDFTVLERALTGPLTGAPPITPEHVLRLVVSRGLRLAAIGAAIGVGAGWLGDSVLRSALPESLPSDLWTFLIPAGSVLVVALLASYIPARRATRIDPVAALRIE